MITQENLKAEIEKRRRVMDETKPPTAKEIAQGRYELAMQKEHEARVAWSAIQKELKAHAERLESLPLADVPAWAARTSELNAVFDAYGDVVKMREAKTERARLAAVNAVNEPNPELLRLWREESTILEKLANNPASRPVDKLVERLGEIEKRREEIVGKVFVAIT